MTTDTSNSETELKELEVQSKQLSRKIGEAKKQGLDTAEALIAEKKEIQDTSNHRRQREGKCALPKSILWLSKSVRRYLKKF